MMKYIIIIFHIVCNGSYNLVLTWVPLTCTHFNQAHAGKTRGEESKEREKERRGRKEEDRRKEKNEGRKEEDDRRKGKNEERKEEDRMKQKKEQRKEERERYREGIRKAENKSIKKRTERPPN
jgi:hypothetical protein